MKQLLFCLALCCAGLGQVAATPVTGDSYRIAINEPLDPNFLGITELEWSGRFSLGNELAIPGVFLILQFHAVIGQCYEIFDIFHQLESPSRCTYEAVEVSPTTVFDSRNGVISSLTGVGSGGAGSGRFFTSNAPQTDLFGYRLDVLVMDSNGSWATRNPYDYNLASPILNAGRNDQRHGTYVIAPLSIPEPDAMLLVALAVSAAACASRRRVSGRQSEVHCD